MIRELDAGGFWRRAAALGVDWLWLFCLGGSLSWLLFGGRLPPDAGTLPEAVVWALQNLLPAAVFIIGWRLVGATPGKVLLELRVVDAHTGGRPSVPRSILRYLGYFLSALPLGLGFLWAVFDRRNQTWHDKIARTRVILVEESILATSRAEPRAERTPRTGAREWAA